MLEGVEAADLRRGDVFHVARDQDKVVYQCGRSDESIDIW